jgi:SAM-dependent methyltransferase
MTATPNALAEDPPEAECPICGLVVDVFQPGGHPDRPRPDCRCPQCGSLERHRALWLFLRDRTPLLAEPTRMLHVAPDVSLRGPLRAMPNVDYVSADLDGAKADLQMDLTEIALPDDSFDLILASHVLEHIPDDVAAMRQLRRILRPGGIAILAVPYWGETTREDLSITDPDERRRLYGQSDHVRMYGRDGLFEERLRSVGFEVSVDRLEGMERPMRRRYRVRGMEPIFACT